MDGAPEDSEDEGFSHTLILVTENDEASGPHPQGSSSVTGGRSIDCLTTKETIPPIEELENLTSGKMQNSKASSRPSSNLKRSHGKTLYVRKRNSKAGGPKKSGVVLAPSPKSKPLRQGLIDGPGFAKEGEDEVSTFRHPIYSKYFKLTTNLTGEEVFRCTVLEEDLVCNKFLKKQHHTYSNLAKHLTSKHKILEEANTERQQRITSHMSQNWYSSSNPTQKAFDMNILNMICVDGAAPYSIRQPGFIGLVKHLDPRLKVKSRLAYMKQIKAEVINNVKPKLKAIIQTLEHRNCHFSLDIWSSRRREGAICIMIHFINTDWELVARVIAFEAIEVRHTAENIMNKFEEILTAYDIKMSEVGAIVTDNASNMVAAFNMVRIIEEESDVESSEDSSDDESNTDDDCTAQTWNESEPEDWEPSDDNFDGIDASPTAELGHHGCLAHTLQLVVNSALSSCPMALDQIKYVRKVMMFFKHCHTWTSELRKITKFDISVPAKTRWNGILDMLSRFQENSFYAAAREILFRVNDLPFSARPRVTPSGPTTDCLQKVTELYLLLLPFGISTDVMQADGPTSNNVIISITTAVFGLLKVKATFFADLKDALVNQCKTRLQKIVDHHDFLMAMMLDPRQKLAIYDKTFPEDFPIRFVPKATARGLLESQFDFQLTLLGFEDEEAQPGMDQETSIYDFLNLPEANAEVTRNDELKRYLAANLVASKKEPILPWWKRNQFDYPILSKLAVKILAIPASTAGVERVFSITGSLARARRARMKMENMSDIIFLREHWKPVLLKRLCDTGMNSRKRAKRRRAEPATP